MQKFEEELKPRFIVVVKDDLAVAGRGLNIIIGRLPLTESHLRRNEDRSYDESGTMSCTCVSAKHRAKRSDWRVVFARVRCCRLEGPNGCHCPNFVKGDTPLSDLRDFHVPVSVLQRERLLKWAKAAIRPGTMPIRRDRRCRRWTVSTEISVNGGEFGKGDAVGELHISGALVLGCHFPGDLVMPGCLRLDAMWQIIGGWLGWSAHRAKAAPSASARSVTRETSSQTSSASRCEVSMREVRRSELAVGIANAYVFVDDTCVASAEDTQSRTESAVT